MDQWLPGVGGWKERLTTKSYGGLLRDVVILLYVLIVKEVVKTCRSEFTVWKLCIKIYNCIHNYFFKKKKRHILASGDYLGRKKKNLIDNIHSVTICLWTEYTWKREKNWSALKCKALGVYINKGSHICIWIQLGKMLEITGPDFPFLSWFSFPVRTRKHWMTNKFSIQKHIEHLHLYIQQTSLTPTMNSLSYPQVCSLFIAFYLSKWYHHPFGGSNKKSGYYLWLFCLPFLTNQFNYHQVLLILPLKYRLPVVKQKRIQN